MKKIVKIMLVICACMLISFISPNNAKAKESANINYQTHIQDVGWQNWKNNGEMSGTESQSKRLEAIKIELKNLENVKIKYQTHIQDIGWQSWKYNGELSGTERQSKRLEAIKIELEDCEEYSVMYRVHIQDIGWQDWKYDGEMAGTEGKSKRLEAIEIKLVNKKAKSLLHLETGTNGTIYYKNDDINISGWKMADVSNTKINMYIDNNKIDESQINYTERPDVIKGVIGYGREKQNPTPGFSISIDKTNLSDGEHIIKIEIIDSNEKVINTQTTKIIYDSIFKVTYTSHVQDIGWQSWRKQGELSGTEGKSKRIEALQIGFSNAPTGAEIKYKVHVQDVGWQDWKSDGQVAGTIGKSKRIEAIQIELENLDDYTIEYKVHIQDIGWTDWYIDGETAGTIGKGLRIEAIKIRIVAKYKRHYIGIDVSHWQNDINYEKLVASKKIDFMITKVGWYSENNTKFIVDSKFERNYKLAKQNKIPLGIYLYSYAKNVEDAKLEANELIKYLKSSGNSSFELPIFYDIEEDSQISYGKKAITDITIAFCETMKNAGYEVGVYSYSYWLNNYMEISRLPADYSLWVADYGTNNNGQIPSDLDKYSETHDIWQFTDKAKIDGINGYVDMNVCYKKYF